MAADKNNLQNVSYADTGILIYYKIINTSPDKFLRPQQFNISRFIEYLNG